MCQGGSIAGSIGQRAVVQTQVVGIDADAVAVILASLHGVVENQGRTAAAGSVAGLHQRAADVERELRCTGDEGVFAHGERDAEHVAGIEQSVLHAGGRTDDYAADRWRDGVHQETDVVAERRVGQRGVVATGVLECAVAQRQAVGGDADAVGVGLTGGDGVFKHQCGAAGARGVVGVDGRAANVEHQLRRAGNGGGLAHVDGDAQHVADIERVGNQGTGRTNDQAADAGGQCIDQVAGVGHWCAVAQRGGVASGVGQRATIRTQAVGGDADAVDVGLAALDGVIEQQRSGARA